MSNVTATSKGRMHDPFNVALQCSKYHTAALPYRFLLQQLAQFVSFESQYDLSNLQSNSRHRLNETTVFE
jgi:hypothetical protein